MRREEDGKSGVVRPVSFPAVRGVRVADVFNRAGTLSS